MRVWHRYLGFFLSGIMGVYAISGVIMIFRNTDFLKVEKRMERELSPGLEAEALGRALRIRGLKPTSETDEQILFKQGQYDKKTGQAIYTTKELPLLLKKFEQMHKATSDKPLFFLNIFFGVSLLFFVVSSFFMFLPKSKVFRRGIYFSLAGLALAVIMVYF